MTNVQISLLAAALLLIALLIPAVRVWLSRRFWRVVDALGLLKPPLYGDGRINDAKALQVRLDRIGHVYLPPGRYRFGPSVTMPRNSSLRGASFDEDR